MCNPEPKPLPSTCAPEPPRVRPRPRSRWYRWLVLLTLCLGQIPTAPAKTILAYYLAGYAAPPISPTWGWHWTMDRFQPDRINALGERHIASWYQPCIGPYDSGDPAVLEYHTLLLRLAGADGVVVSWFGPEDVFDYARIDRNLRSLIPFLQRARLKLVLCYEDRALQAPWPGTDPVPDPAARALQTLQYAEQTYFHLPLYLRWQNRPVLLNFGPQVLRHPQAWEQILTALPSRPALFTIDNPVPAAVGAFAWIPMWLSQAPGTGGVLSSAALHRYLTQFEQAARQWPAAISCAFPRFHDIHPRAGTRAYWGYLGDRSGATFRETLTRALTNSTPMALIATWNGFAEGTQIEPTLEFGTRDLQTLQQLRRAHADPDFPANPSHLEMVRRLYRLRRELARPDSIALLDRAAEALAAYRFEEAAGAIQQAESASQTRSIPPAEKTDP